MKLVKDIDFKKCNRCNGKGYIYLDERNFLCDHCIDGVKISKDCISKMKALTHKP